MEREENTLLSAEGDQDWPMHMYGEMEDTEWLANALREAREEHEELRDLETKLRLEGLALLAEVRLGK